MVLGAASVDRRGRGTGRWPALTAGLYEPHRRRPKTPPRRYGPLASVRGGVAFFRSRLSDRVKRLPVPTLVELNQGLTASLEILPVLVEQYAGALPDEVNRGIGADEM